MILVLMALMIGVSGLAEKIKAPVPVLLLLAGIIIGFSPSMPVIELDPEIIMLIFLPPLLFDAAFNISFKDLPAAGKIQAAAKYGIELTADDVMPMQEEVV